MRIALLDDEPYSAGRLQTWLKDELHCPTSFNNSDEFLAILRQESFDLLILKWNLGGVPGKQMVEWIRRYIDWPIPVVFVTEPEQQDEVVAGLLQGADDYLIKPVRRKELIARITALARRSHTHAVDGHILEHEPFCINLAAKTVTRHGKLIRLTQKEFDLVLFLFRNAGRVLSRNHILESVWGHKPGINTRTVDTHISRLRNKLGLAPENGWRLSGIYHHGYRLEQLGLQASAEPAE